MSTGQRWKLTSEEEGRAANFLNRHGFAERDWWPSDIRVVMDAVRRAAEMEDALAGGGLV